MCILLMTFLIVQMVSCRGPPQNTGPQAIACPIATPLPLGGDADILLHVTCILLIMIFPIVQMVSCRGPPQNTGPQAIACLACPIATPLHITMHRCEHNADVYIRCIGVLVTMSL